MRRSLTTEDTEFHRGQTERDLTRRTRRERRERRRRGEKEERERRER
jgi:hypothetical protein